MRRLCLRLLITAIAAGPAMLILQSPSANEDGSKDQPVLVELFTSEGCSSCPPADKLLADLYASQPVPGVLIIPMAWHVDYWDRLGWMDPYGDPAFSQRQRAYAGTFKSDTVYTPQMIVNGTAEFVGSDRGAALRAIKSAAAADVKPITLERQSSTANEVSLLIRSKAAPASGARVWAALVEDSLTSEVTRGENRGRRLTHQAVVRVLRDEPSDSRVTGPAGVTISLPWDAAWQREHCRAIAAIQSTRDGRIHALGQLPLGARE